MPSRENKSRQKNPAEENDKSFVGNEEKRLEPDPSKLDSDNQQDDSTRDEYRTRNLEIEKERD